MIKLSHKNLNLVPAAFVIPVYLPELDDDRAVDCWVF